MQKYFEKIKEMLERQYDYYDKTKKEAYEEKDWEIFDIFANRNVGIYAALAIVNQVAEEYNQKAIIDGKGCCQSCACTEKCKECQRDTLNSDDIDWYENIDDWTSEYISSEKPNMSEKVTGSDAPDTNVGNKDDCCEWVMCDEDENVYNTACGNSEMLFDGSPIDNNYSFCPYCGKKIKLLECTNCKWYWQNNDTENECSGSATTCVEYSEIAPYQPKGE